jgi:lipopolysaccharide cholinephosphotransferase
MIANKVIDYTDYPLCKDPDGKVITTRQLHDKLLVIMDEIHRICVKNGIQYALIAGSALGVYNYEGFIPWDDDIDICVPAEDWDKFLLALEKDLNHDQFYYHCFEKDEKYNVLIPDMKIRLKGTYCVEKNDRWMPNQCDGNGIFVDVVKYDSVSEDVEEDQYYRNIIKKKALPLCADMLLNINNVEAKREIKQIATEYSLKNKNSKLVSQTIAIPWEKVRKEPIFLKTDVYPFKLYNFEGRQYYSYNNLKKILVKWFGESGLRYYDFGENKWVDPYPISKRHNKHYSKINLNGDEWTKKGE